jgi:phytoene desaturase
VTDAADDAPGPPRVVVIGAGISGLATAALLARGGADVTVLERHDQVGGRAGQWVVDGFTFDTGPSWYLMPEVFEHFFALFGGRATDYLTLRRLDPAYRVFTEPNQPGRPGEVLDVNADAEANWRAFDELEPGAGAAIRRYAAAASASYRLALDLFLYTTFERLGSLASPGVVRRLPALVPLVTRSLADAVARTVTSPRLRQLLGYHAVFLGSSPYRVPALYSLMSHLDLVDGVRYPDGGLYRVIEAIAETATAEGAKVRVGADVVEILVEEDAAARGRGRQRGWARGVRLANGEVFEADVVVSTADLSHTETALLSTRWQTYPASYWASRKPGISALLVYLGVRGELPELAHHSLFFTGDWPGNFDAILGRSSRHRIPSPASLYVSRPSATDATVAPAGHENLMLLVPFPADPTIGAGDPGALDGIADSYLRQVAEWADIPDLMERVVVRRAFGPADFARRFSAWRGSALGLEHTLRQSAFFRPSGASKKVSNLLYAGSGTTPGVGLPMCLISAELVAKRLLGETSSRPLPAPLRRGFLDAARPRGRARWKRAA